jgi:hypothetical protein
VSAAQFAPVDGYRVPERWNGRSFLAVLPSADYALATAAKPQHAGNVMVDG